MKLVLTIEGDVSQLAMVIAALGGSGATLTATPAPPVMPVPPVIPPMPVTPGPAAEDDDNGPVNEAPPAVDGSGLPWDERIHAGAKSANADGTWKRKKGVPA